jgi:hypothetical protein
MKITHINPDSMLKNPAFSQVELWSEMISNRRPSRHINSALDVLRSVGAAQENVVEQAIFVAKGQDMRAGRIAA